MQVLLRCSRLGLALALIFIVDSSVQGLPVWRASYQRVRCNPDSTSANCIEEKGPLFDQLLGQFNRILPPRTDPFLTTRFQDLNDVFPLSEEYSGSGSGSDSGSGSGGGSEDGFLNEIEADYKPAIDFSSNFQPMPTDDLDLGRDGPEQNFII
ncbi:serglycin [Pipistrellus kuhlii]|uniref:Serglycin n=1 Tax=Pipistrellus kuhlii TaxID=59472 RepID=A0A7J7VD07_PIPKU|nr:serglycin [Pipistrellus kuhlii]KAF6322910.1 serglycin [Pipistrellus kuhlii]